MRMGKGLVTSVSEVFRNSRDNISSILYYMMGRDLVGKLGGKTMMYVEGNEAKIKFYGKGFLSQNP